LGEIAHGEVLALLAATDVFLRPTLADGDAISVREALAAGAAVVATSVVPRPAGTRIVAPDAGALAAATLGALEDPPPRRPRPLPSAHHRLLQLYTALLAPSPRLAPARQIS
ncbi:MAG TPA: glycosyltransferase, partial [Myxococcales bacterium]|nr:glycosyltransferase [Myxococcales bacterium]